jgi:hypothetical protein
VYLNLNGFFRRHISTLLLTTGLILPSISQADSIFNMTVTHNSTETRSFSFTTAEELFDQFGDDGLASEFPTYDRNTSTATAIVDYRGLAMVFEYPNSNSAQMIFRIDSIGVVQTFEGADRNASADLLDDFLTEDDDDS